MRILHVISSLDVGGAERALQRLVLHAQHSQNVVVSLKSGGRIGQELREQGIITYELNFNVKSFISSIVELTRILKSERPDLVQTWLYHGDFIGGLAARLAKVPKVVWGVRTTKLPPRSALTFMLRTISALLSYVIPDQIVYVANLSADYHVKLGYQRKKRIIINNGVPYNAVSEKVCNDLRNQLNIPKQSPIVGIVGRYSPDKGHDMFIDVCQLILKKRKDVNFVMVGRGLTTDNDHLMARLKVDQIVDNFRLVGEVENVTPYLLMMDVFCLTSRTEGFPNVLAESMICGTPSVSTNVGDVPIISNGLIPLSDVNDSKQMAHDVEQILELSPSQKKILAHQLKERIKTEFSVSKMVDKYEHLYHSLINKVS